jgi:hypothetical protein
MSSADSPRDEHPPELHGRIPAIAVILGAVASIGGFMFGYESGQISGAYRPSTPLMKLTRCRFPGYVRLHSQIR